MPREGIPEHVRPPLLIPQVTASHPRGAVGDTTDPLKDLDDLMKEPEFQVPELLPFQEMMQIKLDHLVLRGRRSIRAMVSGKSIDTSNTLHNAIMNVQRMIYQSPSEANNNLQYIKREINGNLDLISDGIENPETYLKGIDALNGITLLADHLRTAKDIIPGERSSKEIAHLASQGVDYKKVYQLVRLHLPDVEKSIMTSANDRSESLVFLRDMLMAGSIPEDIKEASRAMIRRHFKDLKEASRAEPQLLDDLKAIAYQLGDDGIAREISESLQAKLQSSPEDRNAAIHTVVTMNVRKIPEAQVAGKAMLDSILKKYQLDAGVLLKAWIAGFETATGPQSEQWLISCIEQNVHTIEALEEKRPGSSAVLQKEFGICSFARYPTEVLMNQYDQREKNDRPYGVALYPRSDWNGKSYNDKPFFENLSQQLEGQAYLRIIECGSKMDIGRKLLRLDQRYGAEHKIDFGVLMAHGYPDGIMFGEDHIQAGSWLLARDLQGKGVQRTGSFFEPGATLIVGSCDAGYQDAIGQKIAKSLGVKVVAGQGKVSVLQAQVTFENGHTQLSVEFRNTPDALYNAVGEFQEKEPEPEKPA